jgi:hypothetical protein
VVLTLIRPEPIEGVRAVVDPVRPEFGTADHHVRFEDVGGHDLRSDAVRDGDQPGTDTDVREVDAARGVRLYERWAAAEGLNVDIGTEVVVPALLVDGEVLHHREDVERPERQRVRTGTPAESETTRQSGRCASR